MSTPSVRATKAPARRAQLTGSGSSSSSDNRKLSRFSRGAIVSLEMENFLSYPKAMVRFGPRLNVVIGPNGSGKSTLVCAIALGLGGSPKVLGRADHLQSFVTHGVNREAKITTELYNPDGENMRIRRTFSRRNNTSLWHLNGRPIHEKQVKEYMADLGIQVENLCTFLPQDKVGDFSRFTPDKLLLETEKALSLESLYRSHVRLIELQESTGSKVDEERSTAEKLESMKLEIASLEKDVWRMKERRQKQEELEMHRKKKLWVRAQMTADEGKFTKSQRKAAEQDVANAAANDAPIVEEMHRLGKEVDAAKHVCSVMLEDLQRHKQGANTAAAQAEKYIGEVQVQKAELKNLETTRRNKENTLKKLTENLKAKVDDLARLRERHASILTMEELNARIEEATTKLDEAKTDRGTQHETYKEAQTDIGNIDQRIRKLTNQNSQREIAFLRKYRHHAEMALKARTWAAQNPSKLRRTVWGPVALEVTVDDAEAAAALEHQVTYFAWCALVVECKEDHDTILEAMSSDPRSLNININEGGRLHGSKVPYSEVQMSELKATAGIRGYLDDFCKCPDAIREVLRANSGMHVALLGTAKTEHRIQQDPEFLKSINLVFAGGSIDAPSRSTFQQYVTTISQYGQRLTSTRVTEVKAATMLMGGVDEEAVRELESKKQECISSMNSAASKRDTLQGVVNKLVEAKEKLMVDYNNLVTAKNRETTMEKVIKRAEEKIKNIEADLSRGTEVEKAGAISRLENALKAHAYASGEGHKHLDSLLKTSARWTAAMITKNVAIDDLNACKNALRAAENAREELNARVRELKFAEDSIRKEFRKHMNEATRQAPKVDNATNETTAFGQVCDSLPDNMDGLDAVIDDLEEDLTNTVENIKVVQKYEKLKMEMEEVEKQLDGIKLDNAHLEEMMQSIREPWVGKLEAMVDKLNELFAECMGDNGHGGEVRLATNEDSYKKWGLDIKVKFRNDDSTKLETLSGQSHSGGERSVATIMFLMALQDLQHSPFRAVDEINQGMDPGNERLVFSRIVRNSSGPDRRQYFLITPKLLQGLVAMDNDDVTIVIIMNGVNCLMGSERLCMAEFIKARKRQLEQARREQGGGPVKIPRRIMTSD